MDEIIFLNYSLYHLIVFALDGLFVGFIGGLFAIGGGTAVVPVMTAFLHYSPKIAVGISVTQMMFSAFFNSFLNYRRGKLNLQIAIFPCIGGLIGGAAVGGIMKIASELAIAYLVAAMLIWAIIKFYMSPAEPSGPVRGNSLGYFAIGLLVGAVATSAGIGGAVLLTPLLITLTNMPLKRAAAISGMFVAFSATGAFISLFFSGHLDILAGILIGLFSIPGVWLGNYCFQRTSNKLQKRLMIIFYFAMLALALHEIYERHGA